ncbi:hypothetical protein AB0873_02135 [Micromonospora sp. NPDC047707]|uniref:hypothetical protein n=1 Tax=unclassified Micromonospora TaxID=2617518 RepID=UPI0012B486A9|nr:hypothetical protein [Micromonospora sp. WMMC415]QGN51012.1 hypothetical protein GKC29_27980 [Micromonospora sp. WMMC415]
MRNAQQPRPERANGSALTRFLVVLTDVRSDDGDRDERSSPERRRQVVSASSREAADRIAGAFMALGMVRAGRQRVKVIAIGRRHGRG